MTPEQRRLVGELVHGGFTPAISHAEFLRRWGASDGRRLGMELLTDAVALKDGEDTEWALVVCGSFGMGAEHRALLKELAFADWHTRHEDVAMELSNLSTPDYLLTPDLVAPLEHLATWVPEYLAWDDARALAVKAVWGLYFVGTEEAKAVLRRLTHDENEIVAQNARERLDKLAADK